MVGNPDFLTGSGKDQAPEFQELESPEGELHLRFYVPSGNEFACQQRVLKKYFLSLLTGSRQFLTPPPCY